MAKKQKCPEFENHERWLVSYADMMTLLFAVFVVLYALKEDGADEAKLDQAAASIQEAFHEVMQEIPPDRRLGPNEDGFGIFEHMKGDQILEPVSKRFPSPEGRLKILQDEASKISQQIDVRLYGNERFRDLKASGQERIISVHRDDSGVQIRMLAAHFFDPGSYLINKRALDELQEVGDIIRDLGRRITIEGHTDSIPPRNGMNNWDLSSLRASHVVKYFIEELNYPPSLIGGAGFADTRPVASNATAASRKLNRRIEVRVHYDD